MPDLRSRFLPVSFWRLVEALAGECADEAQANRFRELVAEMRRIIVDEAMALQQHLTRLYDPFDRDSELVHADPPPRPGRKRPRKTKGAKRDAWDRYEAYQQQRRGQLDELRRCVEYLFDKANFDELSPEGVAKLLEHTRRYGPKVKVDPETFEVCRVFGRGRSQVSKGKRSFRRLGGVVHYEVPSYSRLATVVKQPGEPHVQVYLYRNIDADEFAPLLPGGKVRVGWLDRLIMLAAGGGAIAMVLRLVQTMQSYMQRITDSSVHELPWWPVAIIAAGVLVVGFKSMISYKRSKDRYIRVITKSMFDSSLDNNAGALSYLIRLMMKEEGQEGLLAYAIALLRLGGQCTRTELDAAVELWCREEFDVTGTNFQIGDAVETMSRLGMLEDDGRTLTLRPIEQVVGRLAQMRRDLATTRYHLEAIEDHQRRTAEVNAGRYWTCPNVAADGEICCHHNHGDDGYCDLCGWARSDGVLTREQERRVRAGEPLDLTTTTVIEPPPPVEPTAATPQAEDELLEPAAQICLEHRRGSASLLQKQLDISFARASRLMDRLTEAGLLGPYSADHDRDVLVTVEQWQARGAAAAASEAPEPAEPQLELPEIETPSGPEPAPAEGGAEAAVADLDEEVTVPTDAPPRETDDEPLIVEPDPPERVEVVPDPPAAQRFVTAMHEPAVEPDESLMAPIGASGPPEEHIEITFTEEPSEPGEEPEPDAPPPATPSEPLEIVLAEEPEPIGEIELKEPPPPAGQPPEQAPPREASLLAEADPDSSDALADLLAAMHEEQPAADEQPPEDEPPPPEDRA